MRARAHFESIDDSGRQAIVVTELPYQVNKARLLEKIAEMVKEGKLVGISALRDESDKDGMRMVIELRRGEVAEVILNNLYQHTQMQNVFGINMVALLDGRPRCMNLREILVAFVDHRREVVTRRTIFNLRKARDRAHILEGLAVALANIDAMIAVIKAAANPAVAKEQLLARHWSSGLVESLLDQADSGRSRPDGLEPEYGISEKGYLLSPVQAKAILDLQLHRLTGLEQNKIVDEYKKLLLQIDDLLDILGSETRLMTVIREELEIIRADFGDKRRSEILQDQLNLTTEDLITEEDVVVTMSHEGYVKSQSLDEYRAQRRGGRGKSAASTKQEDFIDKLFIANTHDTILCFSSLGKVYWLKVYELPVASRIARGKPFINLLNLDVGERINTILPIREFERDLFVFMATEFGTVKKTSLQEFERQRSNGKIAIDLRPGDHLVGAAVTDGHKDIMLFSSAGKVVSFNETDVRAMGRTAGGVRGIRLQSGQKVISLIIATEGTVFNITENGYGKRTLVDDFPRHKRGGQGVIAIQTTERNGNVVGATLVSDNDELMLITDGGTLVRTRVKRNFCP